MRRHLPALLLGLIIATAALARSAAARMLGDPSVPFSADRTLLVGERSFSGKLYATPGSQRHEQQIAGVADAMTRHVDMTAALAPTGTEPTIVLSHNPRAFAALPCGPRIMLAAHTHGGQVRLPLIGALITTRDVPHRWMFGHIVEDCREMFVTTGIGTSILPVRFRVPPEIVILTIKP